MINRKSKIFKISYTRERNYIGKNGDLIQKISSGITKEIIKIIFLTKSKI